MRLVPEKVVKKYQYFSSRMCQLKMPMIRMSLRYIVFKYNSKYHDYTQVVSSDDQQNKPKVSSKDNLEISEVLWYMYNYN